MSRPIQTTSTGKPPRRNERRKARDRKRWPDKTSRAATVSAGKPCYDFRKPNGPVLQNTIGKAVATPTDRRGFVMPDFSRSGVSRCGMVYGHGGGYPQGRPHGFTRVLNHHARPSCFKTRLVDSESRKGVPTMTIVHLVRPAAPVATPAGRRAASPALSAFTDTTDTELIRLSAAAENALSMALSLLRDPAGTAADLQRATARASRAATLLKRACAAQVEGGAA